MQQQQTQFTKKRNTAGTRIARYGQAAFVAAPAGAAGAITARPAAAPARRAAILPVLLPLAAVMAVTVGWRGVQTLSALAKGTRLAPAMNASAQTTGVKNPTEKTIAGYVRAGELARKGKDAEAMEAVRALEGAPLVVDRGTFADHRMAELSPSVNLMHVADAFAERAQAAAKAGDTEGAGRWLEAGQALSAHVARSDRPTLEALTTLHYVDDRLARARREVAGGTLGRIVEGQRMAINRFWRENVVRELGSTWSARAADTRPAASGTAAWAALEKADGELASRLMTRYLAEQARLQATASNLGIAPILPPSV